MKNDLENDLEKPGVGPFWESGDPASCIVRVGTYVSWIDFRAQRNFCLNHLNS